LTQLKELGNPEEFWEYFEIISKIPRCSGKEEKIRTFITKEAEQMGFETKTDVVGNLVVNIPPGAKNGKNVVLQCHMDIVCEKNNEIEHDFSKDPIELDFIEIKGEKWITANGTTLGADNGAGIAYMLTLMKRIYTNELIFKKLGFGLLFTVNEESGLKGAFDIDKELFKGDILINLDSEEDDTFTIGCAGGINTIAKFDFSNVFSDFSGQNIVVLKLIVEGLKGGHSGVDIHLGRGNALKIIGRVLWNLNNQFDIEIIKIDGGNKANAIPREANCILLVDKHKESEFLDSFNKIKSDLEGEFKGTDPHIRISIESLRNYEFHEIFVPKVKNNLLNILKTIPNGPISYHPENKDLVHTSTNLASIRTEEKSITIITSQRSLQESSKKEIYEQIEEVFHLANLNINVQHVGDYPGWTPDWDSQIVHISKKIYTELFNDKPKIRVIHAGLECGILKKHFPNMEMISIGPTIVGPHSPDERLLIKSVSKIWNFLLEIFNHIEKKF